MMAVFPEFHAVTCYSDKPSNAGSFTDLFQNEGGQNEEPGITDEGNACVARTFECTDGFRLCRGTGLQTSLDQ